MGRELELDVSKLMHMPTVERSVEGKHSIISRRVNKKFRSGRFVSLAVRVPDIKEQTRRDSDSMVQLVNYFKMVPSLVCICKSSF